MSEEPLIELGVRFDEDSEMFEVHVELRAETHYETEEIAHKAMAEYLASMGPTIMEPSRCIVIPRPERHVSMIKTFKNSHMVKFCVPCGVYTTIAACPCCGVPTLGSVRLPDVEDAGVRARREENERQSRVALKPKHGTVTETADGPIIDVDARPVENPNDYFVDVETGPKPPSAETMAALKKRCAIVDLHFPQSGDDPAAWRRPSAFGAGLHLGPAAGGTRATVEGAVRDSLRHSQPSSILTGDPDAIIAEAGRQGAVVVTVKNLTDKPVRLQHTALSHGSTIAHPDDPDNELADPENCRPCTECVGLTHHWEHDLVDADTDEEEDEPESAWGCKHCDVQFPIQTDIAIVDYALHTQVRPDMVLAASVAEFVLDVRGTGVLIQLQMPDLSWHTVDKVDRLNSDRHVLFLWETGYSRRHIDELIPWRPVFSDCTCSEPDRVA